MLMSTITFVSLWDDRAFATKVKSQMSVLVKHWCCCRGPGV